ncbi:MAG: 5-formyltetrahydrofolate cyclo-ligase [Kordiimonadaceae bacterium]|nr:5-formyltetrahydrofolate cyclo-ligase [Kordiimonadaceae bacterium]MBO6567651.1 5-formyltetrahydrofolate cyclo-ligase [Kordiimonadaceae bacterium]MBO6963135.1 5-formyltetrahydrofolate cyclo-ligase [Kordiimonadaceae bacterium]
MNEKAKKDGVRENARRMRSGAKALLGYHAAEEAAEHGLQLLASLSPGATIGAYWPIRDELDPRFLMQMLERHGFNLALPVVVGPEAPLVFRRWGFGDPLEVGMFKIEQPTAEAPEVVPDALIAPLLAFDADCNRMGYGAGHYDRTLAQHPHIKAFGFAYAAQFVENIPVEPHDWPLQGVVTETGTILPRKKTDAPA